ncbi:DNA-binding transcriptional regulator LsrR, DeoR family [Halobacillus karajensis]|uniref:sugar-binding transcriptional regulator n=1 Tax=Halobacillus karajensis TaxID=195088 RepID=UPI0008A7F504|nr:sugar-binding transcriptional regulator [Halobacillus karajensis]SEH67665.1 DNA-binding transcriptional regulator LsrR, DeoR family [Halobacillus karajensis]
MDWGDQRRLIKVSKMYYEDNMTQNEIAKKTGIYRTTITRLLQKARDEGIVQITIKGDYREQVNLEQQLQDKFGMKEVIVVPAEETETKDERQQKLGESAVHLIDSIMKDDDVVGFAWGSTLGKMVDALGGSKNRDVEFVPLVGGPGKMPVEHHVNTIVYSYAKAYRGHANFIDAAAIVPSPQSKKEIVESKYFQDIINLWENLTIAVVGVGTPVSSSNLVFSGFFGESDLNYLNDQGAIGDICSRFYDINGEQIVGEIDDRTIAITLEKLKSLSYSIGVAESIEKTESIVGALRGGYLSHLVTNDITAKSILEFSEGNEKEN